MERYPVITSMIQGVALNFAGDLLAQARYARSVHHVPFSVCALVCLFMSHASAILFVSVRACTRAPICACVQLHGSCQYVCVCSDKFISFKVRVCVVDFSLARGFSRLIFFERIQTCTHKGLVALAHQGI